MKKYYCIALLLLILSGTNAQYTYRNLQVNYFNDPAEAAKFTYQQLRLYPIYANESFKKQFANIGEYKTLKQAIQSRIISITEKGTGGTVNTLQFENLSSDTIIILSGEIIKGGQQDRIISEDLLLNPKSGKVDVPVYCVESGRWHYNSPRGQKEFNDYFSVASTGLRKVVDKEQNQAKVWNKVEEVNRKNNTESGTKTYTALKTSADFNKKLEAYSAFFKKVLANDSRVIGIVGVSGNRILGCDMFASHQLFKQNFESILQSYATEAIVDGKPVNIEMPAVKRYMDKILTDEFQQSSAIKEKGKRFIDKGRKLKVSSYD